MVKCVSDPAGDNTAMQMSIASKPAPAFPPSHLILCPHVERLPIQPGHGFLAPIRLELATCKDRAVQGRMTRLHPISISTGDGGIRMTTPLVEHMVAQL